MSNRFNEKLERKEIRKGYLEIRNDRKEENVTERRRDSEFGGSRGRMTVIQRGRNKEPEKEAG